MDTFMEIPVTYKDAIHSEDNWSDAIRAKFDLLVGLETRSETTLPHERKAVTSK